MNYRVVFELYFDGFFEFFNDRFEVGYCWWDNYWYFVFWIEVFIQVFIDFWYQWSCCYEEVVFFSEFFGLVWVFSQFFQFFIINYIKFEFFSCFGYGIISDDCDFWFFFMIVGQYNFKFKFVFWFVEIYIFEVDCYFDGLCEVVWFSLGFCFFYCFYEFLFVEGYFIVFFFIFVDLNS